MSSAVYVLRPCVEYPESSRIDLCRSILEGLGPVATPFGTLVLLSWLATGGGWPSVAGSEIPLSNGLVGPVQSRIVRGAEGRVIPPEELPWVAAEVTYVGWEGNDARMFGEALLGALIGLLIPLGPERVYRRSLLLGLSNRAAHALSGLVRGARLEIAHRLVRVTARLRILIGIVGLASTGTYRPEVLIGSWYRTGATGRRLRIALRRESRHDRECSYLMSITPAEVGSEMMLVYWIVVAEYVRLDV